MNRIPLYLSQQHDCDYLPGQLAKLLYIGSETTLDTSVYSQLVEQGFRRSGNLAYRPHCDECSSCRPIRLPVEMFRPSRGQRRTTLKNSDLSVVEQPPIFQEEHYRLYLRYLQSRHPGGSMVESSAEDFIRFLGCDWCDTRFYEFRLAQKLVALAVVDHLDHALSAVYTAFDPQMSDRSLGTYAVTWQIDRAREVGASYLYLGYWVDQCRKMSYKNHFRPYELLLDEQWIFFES